GDEEVERAAQLVQPARVPAREGLALLLRELGGRERRERVGAKAGPEGRVLLEPVKPYVLAVVVGVEDVRHRRRVDDLPPRYGLPQYSRAAGNTGRHLVGWVGPSTVSATAFQTA